MSYKEDILRLKSEGKSYREIEKILGCSKGTISYYLNDKKKDTVVIKENKFQEKATTLAENLLMAKPCRGCSQYLHFSQMNFVDLPNLAESLSKIDSLEGLESIKLAYTNSEMLCNNCNALRLFKLSNR
jgi:transcriptional regulator with XRE-family HTH domain